MVNIKKHSSKGLGTPRISYLQQKLESIWYGGATGKTILFPLEMLYKTIARCDKFLKSKNKVNHPIPIVIVGNISVGGTGKTPLVIYICALLKSNGYVPGIITRGYGGQSPKWPLAIDAESNPTVCGDEPVLIAQRASVPVVAGPNRNENVAKLLSESDVDVIISDDGLQHYALQRDIEVVVIDQSRGLGNGHCLPAGPLREPVSRLDACDFVVSNELEVAAEYSMQLVAAEACNLKSSIKQPLSNWAGVTVHALTGIGNPSRFFLTLKNAGMTVIEHAYPDHYQFDESDIVFDDDLPVVMTEKDAVKCNSFANERHWSIPVEALLTDNFAVDLLAKLSSIDENK